MIMRTIPLHAIDQLNQIENELSTIWLALGNTTDMVDDYLADIREALAGANFRLRDVRRAIADAEGGAV
jgi:ABC-type transporter Mla subunit MlaD